MGCANSREVSTRTTTNVVSTSTVRGPQMPQHSQFTVTAVPQQTAVSVPKLPIVGKLTFTYSSQPTMSQPPWPPIETIDEKLYPEITKEMVDSFQALNSIILSLEQKNIISRLDAELQRQSVLEKEVLELNQHYATLDARTKKEYQDIAQLKALSEGQSVSKYFASQHDYDKQFSKEEEEYLQAKAEQENCYERLVKLQEENSKLSAVILTLKNEKDDLLSQYAKQDEILEKIFGGTYGSSLEDQLEEELDTLEDKQTKIKVAMTKWKNAEAVVQAATSQLGYACKRWVDIQRIPKRGNYHVLRTQVVSESRNYFIAASRNLTSAQRYLHPMKLPYCNQEEVTTLNRAITFIYMDAFTKPRHDHAMQAYYVTHARSIMLYKWIHNVIEKRISVDFAEVSQKSKDCRIALRKERIRLMKKKVEEDTGQVIDIDESQIGAGVPVESDQPVALNEVEQVEKSDDDSKLQHEIEEATAENTEETENEVNAAVAVAAVKTQEANKTPLEDLAPAPSRNELFGDLDSIMAAYDQQKSTLQQEQESARARQEAQVQEKLRRRRSKKMRLDAQALMST